MTNHSTSISNKRHRFAIFSFFFAMGIIFASWASRIPTIKESLDLTEGQLGAMLLMLPLGQLFTLPLSGKIVTRFGSSKVLTIMILYYVLILYTVSWADSIYLLAISLFLFGIGGNMCNIAVNTQAVGIEKIYNKSIMTAFHGAWSLAGFFGALVGLIMMHFGLSIQTHFLVILILVTTIVFFNFQYLLKRDSDSDAPQEKVKFRPDRILLQLGIIGFFSMATEGAMFDWTGVYFQDIVGAPENLIVLGYTAFMIMMATGRFIGDFLIIKFGNKNVLATSGIFMFAGMMLSVLFPTVLCATIGFMLVGLGVACCVPTVYSLAGKHPTIPAGMALAIVSSISFLGFLMGPPLIGYIAELTSLQISFLIFSLFGLAMLIIVLKKKNW